MSIEMLIIADDLTGAVDTAVQFPKLGIPASVSFAPHYDFDTRRKNITVLAFDTESRHLSPGDAAERVALTVGQARVKGCKRFYKKIDSTFRGNVGAELEAFMRTCETSRLMLIPAYPSAGRTTLQGRQYFEGQPVHTTFFGRDPRSPVSSSYIPEIIGKQTKVPVHVIDRNSLRSLDFTNEKRNGIFVFDAQTDDDLRDIAVVLFKNDLLNVAAGAVGFAELLPSFISLPIVMREATRFPPKVLIVNGSMNDISLGQVAWAEKNGFDCVRLSLTEARNGPEKGAAKNERIVESIIKKLRNKNCVLISTAVDNLAAMAENSPPKSEEMADFLGKIAGAVKSAVPDLAMAVFGGDTALAVCRSTGKGDLFPFTEIAPGLTACTVGKSGGQNIIILKSGGFGPVDIVRKIREFIGNKD